MAVTPDFEKRQSLLVFLSIGTVGVFAARYVVPAILPTIISDLDITPSLAGFVLTVGWGSYAFFQYPAGRLADYLTPPTVLVTGLAIAIAGSAMMVVSTTFVIFFLAVLALGVGSGFYLPALYAVSTDNFPERTGSAFGIISASINVGGTLAPVLVVGVVSIAVWRFTYVPIVALLLFVLAVYHVFFATSYAVDWATLDVLATARRLWGDPSIRWTLLATTLVSLVWQGYTSFLPTFLQIGKGFSPYLANAAFAGVFVAGIFVNPVTGHLGDRRSYFEVIIGAGILGTVGIWLMVVGSSRTMVLAGVLCSALGLAGIWPAINAYFVNQFPTASYAGDFGAVRTLFLGIGSIGPTFVGAVAETYDYVVSFGGMIVLLVVSLGIWVTLTYRS